MMLKKIHLTALCISACLITSNAMAQTKKLANIMHPETLLAQVSWLEKQIGPAKKIFDNRREYIVGDCTLVVQLDSANRIANLGLEELSPRCTFGTDDIGLGGPAHLLRFRDLPSDLQWRADVICLFDCGNALDPIYTFQAEGPRAVQFLEYSAEISSAAAGKSGDAFKSELLTKIPARLRDKLPEDPILTLVNPAQFKALWLKHLGARRIESLYFGYQLNSP